MTATALHPFMVGQRHDACKQMLIKCGCKCLLPSCGCLAVGTRCSTELSAVFCRLVEARLAAIKEAHDTRQKQAETGYRCASRTGSQEYNCLACSLQQCMWVRRCACFGFAPACAPNLSLGVLERQQELATCNAVCAVWCQMCPGSCNIICRRGQEGCK